jgi:predicted nucleic acid-binding protein
VILVDTSVWVDHFRRGNARLEVLLLADSVSCHPFVIGELACGNLRQREEVLTLLGELPTSRVATHAEALTLLDAHQLMGRGLGYVDLHLLAAALMDRLPLWTLDKRLAGVADRLGLAA